MATANVTKLSVSKTTGDTLITLKMTDVLPGGVGTASIGTYYLWATTTALVVGSIIPDFPLEAFYQYTKEIMLHDKNMKLKFLTTKKPV